VKIAYPSSARNGAHTPTASRCAIRAKGKKGQEMDARGAMASTIPFLVQQLATSTAHPNTRSLSLPLCVFVSCLTMKACVTEYRISVPCTTQRGPAYPVPLLPSTYELQQHLGASTALYSLRPSRVAASVALPPPHTPFPRIQHPIARSRLAGHWRVIPHLLVLWCIIIVDVGYSADTPVL
jgi:hypothetical protein